MWIIRPHARLSAATVLLTLILAACGSPAITTPTAAPAATAPPAAATAPALTAMPTVAPMSTTAPTAAGQSTASPVEFVRKIDMSEQHIVNLGGLAVDQQGNTYVVDSAANPRILKYDPQGKFVLQWGSKGSGDGQFEFTPVDANGGPTAGFLAIDEQGNVYVSDSYNSRVQKFDPNGKFLAKWGSKGTGEGQFAEIGPIHIDREGNIYVSQFDRIQKFDPDGKFLAAYGSGGDGDGQFTGAAFDGATDSQGNFYVADLLNARVQKFDASWKFLMKWGTAGEGDGQFAAPISIVVDSQDRVYVYDNSTRIQVFDTNGKFLGQWNSSGNGDPPFEVPLSTLAMDRQGNIHVADLTDIFVFRPRQP
jgi:tripartite motif-containing protein 71